MKVVRLKPKVPVSAAHAHALDTGTTSLILLEGLPPPPRVSAARCAAGLGVGLAE